MDSTLNRSSSHRVIARACISLVCLSFIGCISAPSMITEDYFLFERYEFDERYYHCGVHVSYRDKYGWWHYVHQFVGDDGYVEFNLSNKIRVKFVGANYGEFDAEIKRAFKCIYEFPQVSWLLFDDECEWCRRRIAGQKGQSLSTHKH